MAKWYLEDTITKGVGEVFVLKGEPLEGSKQRQIYKEDRTEFKLIYNPQDKMIGYLFRYQYDKIYPKYCLFNSFGVVYHKEENDSDDLSFEVIFEDQVVRLLAFEHPDKVRDYMLVGRWRPTTTDKIADEKEAPRA